MKPLACEAPASLVMGPLAATLNVPAPYTPLPPSGPAVQTIRFSGSDHSTPGGTSSWRIRAPKPTPPTHFSTKSCDSGSTVVVPAVRSTRRSLPT